jgi:hypothetical protein
MEDQALIQASVFLEFEYPQVLISASSLIYLQ